MEKRFSITINGKTYPARFTARVAVKAAERRGSLNKMLKNNVEAEIYEDILWLAAELIRAGTKKLEKDEGIKTEWIPTLDDLLDTLDFSDMMAIQAEVLRVLSEEKPTVKAEGDPKNAEATPAT